MTDCTSTARPRRMALQVHTTPPIGGHLNRVVLGGIPGYSLDSPLAELWS